MGDPFFSQKGPLQLESALSSLFEYLHAKICITLLGCPLGVIARQKDWMARPGSEGQLGCHSRVPEESALKTRVIRMTCLSGKRICVEMIVENTVWNPPTKYPVGCPWRRPVRHEAL